MVSVSAMVSPCSNQQSVSRQASTSAPVDQAGANFPDRFCYHQDSRVLSGDEEREFEGAVPGGRPDRRMVRQV